jgi:hypothetical protein
MRKDFVIEPVSVRIVYHDSHPLAGSKVKWRATDLLFRGVGPACPIPRRPRPGPDWPEGPAPGGEHQRRNPDLRTDAGHQGFDGNPRRTGGPILRRAAEPDGKLTTPEDPLVPPIRLPTPAQRCGDRGPPVLGPQEAPAFLAAAEGAGVTGEEAPHTPGKRGDPPSRPTGERDSARGSRHTSIPRTTTWWRVSGASRRTWRGMVDPTLPQRGQRGNARAWRRPLISGEVGASRRIFRRVRTRTACSSTPERRSRVRQACSTAQAISCRPITNAESHRLRAHGLQ